MCGPISGYQKGKINQTVLRDQGWAKELIKFKYPDYVIDDGKTSFVFDIFYSCFCFRGTEKNWKPGDKEECVSSDKCRGGGY